jgi:hypothetical protein
MSTPKLTPLFAAVLLAAACPGAWAQAAADAPMPLVYDAGAREAPATQHPATCPIRVVPTEDARQNKLTIGMALGGPLLTGDASPWMTNALLQLKDFGYTVNGTDSPAAPGGAVPAAAAPPNGLLIKTTVTRAYTWQIGLKIFSMVAVKAQFVDGNGVLQDKYYRAHGDKTNMWGASSEYLTTLNYGVNNLLHAMAEDLTALCKGKKVEAYTYAGPVQAPPKK